MASRKTRLKRALRNVAKVKAHEYQDQLVLQAIERHPFPHGLTAAEISDEMFTAKVLQGRMREPDALPDGRTILPALRRLLAAGKITKTVVHRNTCLWGLPERDPRTVQ